MSTPAIPSPPQSKRTMVDGGGGVPIAAYEFGDGGARRPVLLIHGFMQCHLTWSAQVADERLLADRRVVALDLRGHGASGRELPPPAAPDAPPGYAPRDYADDVQAVIDGLGLEQPILVGWSYGGLVVSDYLRTHGTQAIGGIVLVCAAIRFNPPTQEDTFIGPGFLEPAQELFSPEPAFERATRQFLANCFHTPLAPEAFEYHLAYNLDVPAANRLALLVRGPERFDETTFGSVDVPALVIHGEHDTVVLPDAGRTSAAALPDAELRLYEGSGHAPMFEEPRRLTDDLLAFLGDG